MSLDDPPRDMRREILDRLRALGCPVPYTSAQLQQWTREALRQGALERTAVSVGVAAGRSLGDVGRECGMSPWRVLHHLSREPGFGTSDANIWQLVDSGEGATA